MIRSISGCGFLVAISLAPLAYADPSCDCNQIVGSCAASLSIRPSAEERKGWYAVEMKIQSSSPVCSKVEYYVEQTPYFNVLSNKNTDTDTLWGQKPITRADITDLQCKVCKRVDDNQSNKTDAASTTSPEAAPTGKARMSQFLQGTWCADTGDVHTVIRINGSNVGFSASYQGGPPSTNSAKLVLLDNDEFEFQRGNGTDKFSVVYEQGFRWIGRNGGAAPYPGNLASRCGG